MNKIRKDWLIDLIIILLIAGFLYLYHLGSIPNGFYADEASIGLNAKEIALHGTDQYGISFPFYFKSFGEYKNPVYIYTASILIEIFGDAPGIIRSTGVLFTLGSIILVYAFGRRILKNRASAVFGSIMLIFLPWNFDISRVAFEVASSTFLFLLSLYLLNWWSIHKEKKNYLYGGIFTLAVFLYSYSATRLYSILLFGIFALYHYHYFLKQKKEFVKICLWYLFLLLPFLYYLFAIPEFSSRFEELSVTGKDHPVILFLRTYFAYFSPNFLLLHGDGNIRHHSIQNMGQLFWSVAGMSLIGLGYSIWARRKWLLLIVACILIYPIPGALTGEVHALRSVLGIGIVIILATIGVYLLSQHTTRRMVTLVFTLFILGFMGESYVYIGHYFQVFPRIFAYSQSAFDKEEEDLGHYLEKAGGQYDRIFITENNRIFPLVNETFYQWYLTDDISKKILPLKSTDNPEAIPKGSKALIILSPNDTNSYTKGLRPIALIQHDSQVFFEIYTFISP